MIRSRMQLFCTLTIVLLLLLNGLTLAGPSAPDREDDVRIERLIALGKLWVAVKYFHPWLAYQDIDWDAAFIAAVPKIQAAKTKDEYSAVVRQMLAVLADPCTRLKSETPGREAPRKISSSVQMRDDGILVVAFGNSEPYQALQKIAAQAIAEASKAKVIVFDLRDNHGSVLSSIPLNSKPFQAPGLRHRLYSGYPPPDGSGSGGYYSSFVTAEGNRSLGSPRAPNKPVILLVNRNTRLTPELLGLQAAGLGAIVAEDGMDEESIIPQITVKLADGLVASVRTGELIYPDGTGGVTPNKLVTSNGLDAALELARSGSIPPPERKTVPATGGFPPDLPYAETPYPSEALRALAAFRIWSVFTYFHPYKHLTGEDWDSLLRQYVVKMMQAANALEYHKAVAEMASHSHDTHCMVVSAVLVDLYGAAPPPLAVRWIEENVVVTKVAKSEEVKAAQIAPGDVVLKVDGRDVRDRMKELSPYIAASTPQALTYRTVDMLLNGKEGSVAALTIKNAAGQIRDVSLPRSRRFQSELDRVEGEPIRLIDDRIGYVDLTKLQAAQVDEMFEKFRNTQAFIMDMRGYPQGTAWSIAPRLSERDQPVAAQFRRNLVTADNITSYYFEQRIPHTDKWRYAGKTVMLIDERAISQAEHSGLFYETANGTKFIGSATNGANGDVTWFWAPGRVRISFTGHDVRHADGKQLQRVGLQPDIEVKPTIAGIRAGRDEVLEKAIEYLMTGP